MTAEGVLRLLAFGLATAIPGLTPLHAQAGPGAPSPDIHLEWDAEEEWSVVLAVPRGWTLYAPDTGELGLPLRMDWVGPRGPAPVHPPAWPASTPEGTAAGPVRVYRGRIRIPLGRPAPGASGVAVRWALCRADLCVPGRTILELRTPGSR